METNFLASYIAEMPHWWRIYFLRPHKAGLTHSCAGFRLLNNWQNAAHAAQHPVIDIQGGRVQKRREVLVIQVNRNAAATVIA